MATRSAALRRPLVGTQRDAPEDASSRHQGIVADVDQVPVPLGGVAEDEERVGVVSQQLVDGEPFVAHGEGERAPGDRVRQASVDHVERAGSRIVTGQEDRRLGQGFAGAVGPVAVREGLCSTVVVQFGPEELLGRAQPVV
jgi:hypothetical protein